MTTACPVALGSFTQLVVFRRAVLSEQLQQSCQQAGHFVATVLITLCAVHSPGVCKQKLAGLPLQHLCSPQHSNKWQMSRSSAASHFSDLSSQSSAKYPKLFSEPALPGHAAMVSPYHIKAQRLRLPADSYDEQVPLSVMIISFAALSWQQVDVTLPDSNTGLHHV